MKNRITYLLLWLLVMACPIAWAQPGPSVSGKIHFSDGAQVEVSTSSSSEAYRFLMDFVGSNKDGKCQLLHDEVVELEIEKVGDRLTVSENDQKGTFTAEELLKILAETYSRKQMEEIPDTP